MRQLKLLAGWPSRHQHQDHTNYLIGPHRALTELNRLYRKWNKQLENFTITHAHVKIIEQQITHPHMKTIQKSRNHNFRMRWLTNYRFLHRLLPTMQYWCYNHRNRNRFLTENRIEIVIFVHPVKRFVHLWSIGSLIDAVALQQTDHTLQRGRSSVFKLFICHRRPPLGWSEREVTGEGVGLVLFLDKQSPRTDIGR